MSDLIALRKALAVTSEGLAPEAKKAMAIEAIAQILDAIGRGVCFLGDWEKRCLAGAIVNLRAGKFDDSRTLARRALWPEENRRSSGVARFPLRPGMSDLAEFKRELDVARAMPVRGAPKRSG
jgi:hypothetical protein